jgi:hypothetical protein
MTAAALVVGLLLAACSGNESAVPASSQPARQELTAAQFKAMMPTRRELDLPLWGVMSPAERVAGSMDNRRAARETALWSVSREDLDSAGRIGGFIQYFWDGGCGGTCLGRPLLTLRTEAHVFGNAAAASRFLLAGASRYRAQDGKRLGSFRQVSVEEFEPGVLGDEVVGFRTVMGDRENFTGFTWRDTIFLFRVDRIVCLATATSLNDKNPAGRASEAARILDRRVEAVLSAP